MEYITIYETLHLSEVSIIKNLFEEHQIPFLSPDEVTNNSYGIAALGISGMRVQVLLKEKEKATALLKDRGFHL